MDDLHGDSWWCPVTKYLLDKQTVSRSRLWRNDYRLFRGIINTWTEDGVGVQGWGGGGGGGLAVRF